MKLKKTLLSLMLIAAVFASSCMICSAANGPGDSVRKANSVLNQISCKVLKDQNRAPYYKYNWCSVRLREGKYDRTSNSPKFSQSASSYQSMEASLTKANDPFNTCYTNYKLYSR